MSSATAADAAAIVAACPHPDAPLALLSSWPHPDTFAQDLVQQLRAAVEAFKSDNGSSKSLTALAKAFKNAGCALDHAAPPPGQHVFLVGERAILQDLKQRADLNGCVAVVKCAADDVEGDGRVEVCAGLGGKKEMLRVRPANMRLDWHVAADVHVTSVGRGVVVRRLDSAARGRVCRVAAYDAATRSVSLLMEAGESSATHGSSMCFSVSDVVPAAYGDISKEVHSCAMKVIMKAAAERHTPGVTAAFNALESCATFYIRCARDDEAARACVSVLKLLHTGGRIITPRDAEVRRSWTGQFLITCTNFLYCHFRNNSCFAAAVSVLRQCKQIVVDNEGLDSINVAAIHHNIAGLHERLDQYDDAEAEYKHALRISELTIGRSSEPFADILLGLGALHEKQNRLDDAEAAYKEALVLFEGKNGRESHLVAQVLSNLAVVQERQERLDEAEKTYEEAMRIKVLVLGHETLDVAEILNNLAGLYQKLHRLDDAATSLHEALRLRVKVLGKESLEVAETLSKLAVLHSLQDQLQDAEAMHTEALRIRKLKLGPESFKVSTNIHSMAALYQRRGLLDEAEAMFKEALRIQELRLGRDSVHVAAILSDLAILHEEQGRVQLCEDLLVEALRIRVQVLGHDTLEVATSLQNLGGLHERQGRVNEAETCFMEALRIQELKLGTTNIGAASTRNRLSELHPPPLSDI
jgi:tetratricopeptide (TPR) repeat protein